MNSKLLLCVTALAMWAHGCNASLRREFRIQIPFTPEQYRIGHLWSVAEWSKLNTGGGEGVEIVVNEPFESEDMGRGQFTHKIFHLSSKVPRMLRVLAPKGSLEIHEESWNVFPNTKTVISNPDYMNNGFHVTTYTRIVGDDDCQRDDIFDDIYNKRDKGAKKDRVVIPIDIVTDAVDVADYDASEDPAICRSEKLDLGPLSDDWKQHGNQMCVYKLVETEFLWFGLQGTVESRIQKFAPRFFRALHRQMFCWADHWVDLSMDDIRLIEAYTKIELDKKRQLGKVVGMAEE